MQNEKLYNKTSLPELLTVKTIISIFRREICHCVPPDVHDFWEISYVEKGTSNTVLDDCLLKYSEGDCIIFAPNSVHSGSKDYKINESVILNNVCFDGDLELLREYSNKPISLNGAQRKKILEIVSAGAKHFERKDGVSGMVLKPGTNEFELKKLKNELELFLLGIVEFKKTSDATMKNTKNHVDQSFSRLNKYLTENLDKSISISDMADALSVSESTLKSICKLGADMSPTSYFIYLKMKLAKELIEKSSLNFTEISESLGFSSVHYFSKLFKEKIGMTPTEYAKFSSNK